MRRYGKPWIAKIRDWPIGKQPDLEFGNTINLIAEIDAAPGQLVRWGQKDHRGRNSNSGWGIVQQDGSVKEIDDIEFCRQHWLAGCPVPEA
jgi:hypothetical protein